MLPVFEGLGRLLKILATLLGAAALALLAVGGALYLHFAKNLPKIGKMTDYRPPVVSEVFSDDGAKIGEFWEECRYLLPYEQVPRRVIEAFVASEDERFWEHRGIDTRSILRAFLENLKAGRVVQGGSTITQQVTRSLLLSREKSLERKVKEAILATQLEQNLTKEQILTLYLNQIYLGNRAYGVHAAAQNYFHKGLKDLNLAEIALVAGLPSAPASYSPLANPAEARRRQQHVLNRMFENNYISRSEMKRALDTPLTLYVAGTDKDFNKRFAPFFVEEVRRAVEEKYGREALYYGGLKIETTASLKANQAGAEAIRKGLEQIDGMREFRGPIGRLKKEEIASFAEAVHQEVAAEANASLAFPSALATPQIPTPIEEGRFYKAVVVQTDRQGNSEVLIGHEKGFVSAADRGRARHPLKSGEVYWVRKKGNRTVVLQEPLLESALFSLNPLTGEIKAIVGGYDFKRSEFNRATQAMRQPGSAFKPVVYAAALDKGYTPKTVVIDAPVVYRVGGKEEFWSPKNYGEKFNGPMSIRGALVHSVNVIAVKVLYDIGIDYMTAYARKLGMTSPINKYLSSALGANDVTLAELTRIYATIAAGGIRPDPFFIRKITDKNGIVLEENPPRPVDEGRVFDRPADLDADALNPELAVEGEKVIGTDHLDLSIDERKILYGGSIPSGHVVSPQTAFVLLDMMRDVVERGTGYKAKELGRPVAGKTGTTNDESDAWFIGAVPDLITGVWVGYDSRRPIGEKMTGGVVAAPIWLEAMKKILEDRPVKDFPIPSYINVAEIDSLAGGSAVVALKKRPAEENKIPVAGEPPPSRGIDFLYQDLDRM